MSSQLNILCYDMLIIQLKRFNSTALLVIVKKISKTPRFTWAQNRKIGQNYTFQFSLLYVVHTPNSSRLLSTISKLDLSDFYQFFIYDLLAGSSRSAESSSSSAASLSATPSSQENGGSSSQSDHSQQQQQLHQQQQQQQRLLVSKLSVVNTNTNTSSTNNPNESLESPSAVQAAMATVNSRKNVRN